MTNKTPVGWEESPPVPPDMFIDTIDSLLCGDKEDYIEAIEYAKYWRDKTIKQTIQEKDREQYEKGFEDGLAVNERNIIQIAKEKDREIKEIRKEIYKEIQFLIQNKLKSKNIFELERKEEGWYWIKQFDNWVKDLIKYT